MFIIGTTCFIGGCNLFPGCDIADFVDQICIMHNYSKHSEHLADNADVGADSTNHRFRPTWSKFCLDNTTERMLAGKLLLKGKKLSLLVV